MQSLLELLPLPKTSATSQRADLEFSVSEGKGRLARAL